MLHTTFKLLHDAGACKDRYRVFAKKMGGIKKYGRDKPIPLTVVLDHMGLDDCLWTLQAVLPEEEMARDRLARTFACDCAEHVLPIFEKERPTDPRPRQAIETTRRYLRGEATEDELAAARAAAGAAAWDAADAAGAAAWAAWAAADAAWDAADAAGAAAWAAWAAARAAAWATEREWQEERLRGLLEELKR